MRHHIMGLLEWECTVCLCPIKSSLKLIVSYPLPMLSENEKLEKYIKHMYNKTIQPPEANAQYLGWAEFARGRVCQGPSLSGAEMSQNRKFLFTFKSVSFHMCTMWRLYKPLLPASISTVKSPNIARSLTLRTSPSAVIL